jgi:iron complex outermembrane receptor protein
VFTAVPRLNVTLDVYQVSIDDRIVVTENLSASRDAAGNPSGTNPGRAIAQILNNAGFRVTNAARFFVNGLDTRTRGLDLVGTYRMDLGDAGRLTLTAGYNYNKTKLTRILAAPGPLANVPGVVLFGRQEQLRLTQGQPRDKINLALDYERGWLGATLRSNRYGEVFAAGGELPPAGSGIFNDVEMQPKWVTDFEIRASAGEMFQFALGANNIFDVYPTQVPTGLAGTTANGTNVFFPATSYVVPWSQYSPFGFNGRFVYGRMSIKF